LSGASLEIYLKNLFDGRGLLDTTAAELVDAGIVLGLAESILASLPQIRTALPDVSGKPPLFFTLFLNMIDTFSSADLTSSFGGMSFYSSLDKIPVETTFDPKPFPLFENKITCCPKWPTEPNLLLHDIGRTLSTISYKNGDCLVLGLSSGTGKTRTMYEEACKTITYYFVADTHGNGGSEDFRQYRACYTKEDVGKFTAALLGSREAVFRFVGSKLKRAPTPVEWLHIQLYPTHFFKNQTGIGCDLFAALLPHCKSHSSLDFPIILDEAQGVAEIDPWQPFSHSKDGEPLPILTTIVEEFPHNVTIFVAGTSPDMAGVIRFLENGRPAAIPVRPLKLYLEADDAWTSFVRNFRGLRNSRD